MSLSLAPVRPHKVELDRAETTDVAPVSGEDEGQEEHEHAEGAGRAGAREEDDHEEAGDPVRCLPCPGNPSAAERAAHEVTHWPYRPWCDACARGRAVGPNSKKIPDDKKQTTVPRAHLDYAFLQDEVIEEDSEFEQAGAVGISMTLMVMMETLCGSVWAYATSGKGFAADPWLPKRVHLDLVTVGMGHGRIIVKTDNEPAILDVRKAIAGNRGDAPTAFEDSRVGDSNSNGKVERVIREVKGLIRTFRADLQSKINDNISLDSPIVPWLVRHAGYIITRCRVHECGRTAMQKI